MQRSHDDVIAAKTVLIIGGGAVGVELAGHSVYITSHIMLALYACMLACINPC